MGVARLAASPLAFGRHLTIALLLAIAAGLAWRVVRVFVVGGEALLDGCDGSAYWDLAQSFAAGDGLTHTNPNLLRCGPIAYSGLGPSHHYSPLLPILEAGAIQVLGPSLTTLRIATVLLGALAVGVAYWASRDLLGPSAALLVAAWASWDWSLRSAVRWGYSEPVVFITLCLTLWAIVRSLKDERYILWAGLFAGLGYLSKASLGWFFLVAGLGGLAWRLLHRGSAVFRNKWYLGAIGIFGAIFAAWAGRNLSLFWDGSAGGLLTAWQTSAYNSHVFASAASDPALLLWAFVVRLPITVWGIVPAAVAFWGPLREQARRWRDEAVSGLLLAAALLVLLGWVFAAAFFAYEGDPSHPDLLWADPMRYVAAAQLPLLWLALSGPEVRPWRVWLLGGLTVLQGLIEPLRESLQRA